MQWTELTGLPSVWYSRTEVVTCTTHSSDFILEHSAVPHISLMLYVILVTKRTAEGGESDDTYLSAYDHLRLSQD